MENWKELEVETWVDFLGITDDQWTLASESELPKYTTPLGFQCPSCKELCKVVPMTGGCSFRGLGNPCCDKCGSSMDPMFAFMYADSGNSYKALGLAVLLATLAYVLAITGYGYLSCISMAGHLLSMVMFHILDAKETRTVQKISDMLSTIKEVR